MWEFLNISSFEIIIIVVVILLVIGPEKLLEYARKLVNIIGDFILPR